MSFKPEGIFPALPTPISEDGSINYEAAENHIEYLEENGVHGIVPAGCTGHAATLGDHGGENLEYDEHVEFVRRTSEMTDLPVIAGDGMNSTQQTLELASRIEEEADIDAHLMISPYQNCPPQDLIIEHYETLAENLEKPIIAYNVPGRTGRNIEAETTVELAGIDGVIGIKEASLDYAQIHEIGRRLEEEGLYESFYFGSGDDAANHFVFEQRGSFAISVSANIHPEASVEVWALACEEEDFQAAFERNQELRPLHDAMFQPGEKNPISVQYAVNLLGFDFGTPRAPLNRRPREDEEYENRTEIRNVLEQQGLI
ncbi:MAG: 4-hydroxy-tetrahydrodipicolinate synthase [Nanohaloarchaea archaeon SW_7_46_7]|nr:MAG: 4-hydroxy-tetrahydrodipicolinate synthase [Nanohaloarchaea archaeon SW_7_46_7]